MSIRFQERLAVITPGLAAGQSPEDIADRLGTTVTALAKQLTRRGHPDLARPFVRARSHEQTRAKGGTPHGERMARMDDAFTDRLEEIQFLTDAGLSPAQIAADLGVTPGAVANQLLRRGHRVLARPFYREERRRRAQGGAS